MTTQGEHLDEVARLIEQWYAALDAPRFDQVYLGMQSPTHDLEANPLFRHLKEHLPYPELWQDYATWTSRISHYLDSCQKLMREIGKEAKRSSDEDMVKKWGWGTRTALEATIHPKPYVEMMQRYRQRAKTNLMAPFDELKALEVRLRSALQESLSGRKYAIHRCKACPGESR
jgi:hypothetical protein